MNNLCGKEFLTGPFDECIACPYLRNGCSGPRTSAMEYPRWIVWIKAVMERFGIKNRHIAEGTPLSKSTVDDILAGRRKDMTRSACCYIENFVLGDGKWPCARTIKDGSDVVYEDRPETLEALRIAQEDGRELREALEDIHDSYEKELEKVRADGEKNSSRLQRMIDHLIEQLGSLRKITDHLREENARKSKVIDGYMEHYNYFKSQHTSAE